MIDLTNKNIDELKQKYASLLELTPYKEHIPYLAYIYEFCIDYIKQNYNQFLQHWKIFAVMIIKDLQIKNKINNEEEIKKILDGFFNYLNTDYQKYVDNLGMFASEYDRDYGFMCQYVRTLK